MLGHRARIWVVVVAEEEDKKKRKKRLRQATQRHPQLTPHLRRRCHRLKVRGHCSQECFRMELCPSQYYRRKTLATATTSAKALPARSLWRCRRVLAVCRSSKVLLLGNDAKNFEEVSRLSV